APDTATGSRTDAESTTTVRGDVSASSCRRSCSGSTDTTCTGAHPVPDVSATQQMSQRPQRMRRPTRKHARRFPSSDYDELAEVPFTESGASMLQQPLTSSVQ